MDTTTDKIRERMASWVLRLVDVDGREIMRCPAMVVARIERGTDDTYNTPANFALSQIATVELGPEGAMSSAPVAADPALFAFGDMAVDGIRLSLHRGMVAFYGATKTHRSVSYTTPQPAPEMLL